MQKAGLKIKKTADLPYNLQECHLYTFLNTWTENLTYSFVYFIYLYIYYYYFPYSFTLWLLLLFPLFLYTPAEPVLYFLTAIKRQGPALTVMSVLSLFGFFLYFDFVLASLYSTYQFLECAFWIILLFFLLAAV